MGARGAVRAGFVLVGGRSSRMGRDKALLPFKRSTATAQTMAGHIAGCVRLAAGSVTLVGSPEKYGFLGYPVIADRFEGCGPLGGVYTALSVTEAEWNLIVACDMPELTAGFLGDLLAAAEASPADCLVPASATGLDPLCAVYRRRCVSAAESAISRNILKMHDFVSGLPMEAWPVSDPSYLANVNRPEEWGQR
jgi:molybdopterin-guanine dinucleotide biosynthesis protein A